MALACLRSADLVSNRSYLGSTDLGSFGMGLSWWFPERAATFLEREDIPAQIFNTYNEGGSFHLALGSPNILTMSTAAPFRSAPNW